MLNMNTDDNITKQNARLAVYYWTNLASITEGHGLDQQKQDLLAWCKNKNVEHSIIAAEFTDKHLKRTKPKHFPELAKAINYCLENNTQLVITKLNGLISQREFADLLSTPTLQFICIDKPLVTPEALSVVREYIEDQSKQHGANIKRGLKLTTNKLGNPNAAKAITPFNKIKTENSVLFALLLQPIIAKYQQEGMSQRKIVAELNEVGVVAPEGGKWVLSQLQKVLKRIDLNNLALDVSNEINEHHYQDYSSLELIQKLTEGIAPARYTHLNEESLREAQQRNETIHNTLELYNFLQQYETDIDKYITDGYSLIKIAEQLNIKSLTIPKALLDDERTTDSVVWDQELVEKLITRMTNELKLPYNDRVLQDFAHAIKEYVNNNANNDLLKEVYNHRALQHLLNI